MSIHLFCPCNQCGHKNFNWSVGELSDKEYSILNCSKGHKTKYFLGLPDYPLFFDNGIDAYMDGNYFEAFTSIYHCWEKFINLTSQTILMMYTKKSYEDIQSFMKSMRNSSVQLEGAFTALYALHFKKIAPTIDTDLKKIRNKIVHGTRNPQAKDVEQCAKKIYAFIKPIEIEFFIRDSNPDSIFELFSEYRIKALQNSGLINRKELDERKIQITSEGQHILGKTPRISGGESAYQMLTFSQMIEQRKNLKIFEDHVRHIPG